MRLSLSSWWGALLVLSTLTACSPVRQTAAPNTAHSRYGTVKVEALHNSGISGTFTARDNGDGTTWLEIRLDNAGDFNLWGIYALADCESGVPLDQRPIFELPDIEAGQSA